MRQLELSIVTVVVAALFGLIFFAAAGGLAGVITVVVVVGVGLSTAWFVRRRFHAWRYQERHEDLIVARGVMVHRLSVVPYGRMQFVEVTAGPIERIFNLSTVKLHTAAAASDARIPGLEQSEATRLRDRLTQLGESKAAGM
jgi:membrane protein YdbS with pleckstrin-like domain